MSRPKSIIRRLITATGIALATITTSVTMAAADTTPPPTNPPKSEPHFECGEQCGSATDSTGPFLEAGATRQMVGTVGKPGVGSSPAPTRSSFFDSCDFEFVEAGDPAPGSFLGGTVWPDDDYWVVFCGPNGFDNGTPIPYTFYPDGDPPPVSVIEDMFADAWRRVPLVFFDPITSPDGNEDIMLITQVITYLWVDEADWNTPRSAVSTLDDGFTVTVTGTPRIAYWTGGDKPIECNIDDMEPYDFSLGEDGQTSKCSMVYKQSSAVEDQYVNVEVVWDVVGTCNDPNTCGTPVPMPDKITTTEREVLVGEIQAISGPVPSATG